ncbi:tRNA pseudouridine synthase A [Actinotignum timonense]|uniref:tRNA pseudouridine synthase A n=1 Tax=Actinotignum timonense TaxID=1870995 RepID=UPI002A82861A|nr:tRNA pseudouridine synthase A [Actinotignum timonense]MDY5134623.1 tRNA pseudouridine synthase A [Actinotignum timonense]
MSDTLAQNLRLRLDLSYDGTEFHGWAAQPGLRTVEGTLTEALATVLRVPVTLTVAGRTDAGVHARGQGAHMDVPRGALAAAAGRSQDDPTRVLVRRVQGLLARDAGGPRGSADIVLHSAREVSPDFEARFSAVSREYTYRIAVGHFDPLRRRDVLWLAGPLDLNAMREAAASLLGEHDFLSYCKPRPGATTVRELLALDVAEAGELVTIHAVADAFCHSMVRTLVGSLLRVGEGQRDAAWPLRRLHEASRDGEVVVAPPHPLTLEKVNYPEPSQWAARAAASRAIRTLLED